MKKIIKKSDNRKSCPYCGEAPVNHTFVYFENLVSSTVDSYMAGVMKYIPHFIKRTVDQFPVFLFRSLVSLNLAHFSSDIEKANNDRSKIIWAEAEKRGIKMEQVILGQRPLDWYRAKINGRYYYFESIPIQPEFLDFKQEWDNKAILKKELSKHGIPVPKFLKISILKIPNIKKIFSKLKTPVIIKPQVGSRSRHTVTNINTLEHFKKGVTIAGKISPHLIVEEHLDGYICRATVVGGVLAGFYKGDLPSVVGDGLKTIRELIKEKDERRIEREHVRLGDEFYDHIERAGFTIDDVLPKDFYLTLSHHRGQLFGGVTKEMIDEVHPSFIPIFEKAAKVLELSVVGFDCIIPDPMKEASSQRWGIIECNTLPFIDMHYYALEGQPRNIAGMIWDLWL